MVKIILHPHFVKRYIERYDKDQASMFRLINGVFKEFEVFGHSIDKTCKVAYSNEYDTTIGYDNIDKLNAYELMTIYPGLSLQRAKLKGGIKKHPKLQNQNHYIRCHDHIYRILPKETI